MIPESLITWIFTLPEFWQPVFALTLIPGLMAVKVTAMLSPFVILFVNPHR